VHKSYKHKRLEVKEYLVKAKYEYNKKAGPQEGSSFLVLLATARTQTHPIGHEMALRVE